MLRINNEPTKGTWAQSVINNFLLKKQNFVCIKDSIWTIKQCIIRNRVLVLIFNYTEILTFTLCLLLISCYLKCFLVNLSFMGNSISHSDFFCSKLTNNPRNIGSKIQELTHRKLIFKNLSVTHEQQMTFLTINK